MNKDKLSMSKEIIELGLKSSSNPVLLCSFGKDSIVVLDIIRKLGHNIPVIFFREPFYQEKFVYAQKVMADMNLDVYDYPPSVIDYIQLEGYFEVFNYYSMGVNSHLLLYGGTCGYDKDKPYLCAINNWLNRPTIDGFKFNWDCVFFGQKEADPTYITNKVKLKEIYPMNNHCIGVLPIKNWTDEDIWEYIKENNVPYDKDRYDNKNDIINPDKFPTCFDCLDYRNGKEILCPKINKLIPNISKSKEEQYKYKESILSNNNYMKGDL
jgi:phosphoadenosine phosphosulfate reductase